VIRAAGIAEREGADPWARADSVGVQRAEQRHAQEGLRWRASAQDAGTW
jgi:hypothetical protein